MTATPTTRTTARVVGVDLARTVALLGMFAAHLVSPVEPGAPGGVDPLFQGIALGVIILLAVGFYAWSKLRRS